MKKFLRAGFILSVLLHSDFLMAQFSSQPFAVVELFTSEGCSSCPPAEKLLNKVSSDAVNGKKNIFCLEYHVDYWNRGGWKDPYSKNQFSKRQDNYSSVLHHGEIYTPQMIVNGETEFTGSDEGKANAAIDKALKVPAKMKLSVTVDSVANDSLYLQYRSSKPEKNTSLHFAFVEDKLSSKISSGENSGKTLVHDNVVRIFYSVGLTADSGFAAIPLKGVTLNKNCALISFAQQRQTMKIFSATKVMLNTFSK
jgi:hypothetical protein